MQPIPRAVEAKLYIEDYSNTLNPQGEYTDVTSTVTVVHNGDSAAMQSQLLVLLPRRSHFEQIINGTLMSTGGVTLETMNNGQDVAVHGWMMLDLGAVFRPRGSGGTPFRTDIEFSFRMYDLPQETLERDGDARYIGFFVYGERPNTLNDWHAFQTTLPATPNATNQYMFDRLFRTFTI
ncbi:MAG: hypothetical protein AAF846_16590 [Chloroflexota bacterium]